MFPNFGQNPNPSLPSFLNNNNLSTTNNLFQPQATIGNTTSQSIINGLMERIVTLEKESQWARAQLFNLRNEFDNYRKFNPAQNFSNQPHSNIKNETQSAQNNQLKAYLAQSFTQIKNMQNRHTTEMAHVLKMLNYQSQKICTLSSKVNSSSENDHRNEVPKFMFFIPEKQGTEKYYQPELSDLPAQVYYQSAGYNISFIKNKSNIFANLFIQNEHGNISFNSFVPNDLINSLLKNPSKMVKINQMGCQIYNNQLEKYPFNLKINNFMGYTNLSQSQRADIKQKLLLQEKATGLKSNLNTETGSLTINSM